MEQIPVRFKRVAAAFDEISRFRSCDESSGSEHSADLSDLVNSFFEREIREQKSSEDHNQDVNGNEFDDDDDDESDLSNSPDIELQDSVRNLLEGDRDDEVKRSIYTEVEKAVEGVDVGGDGSSSPEFKRRLMAGLRNSGFDAGLCKSKWERKGSNPSGKYEYIDVNAGGARYIVEVFLAGEFTIARPTGCYASLLDVFPRIYVGKPEELKKLVKIMSRAVRKSLKSVDLNMPPWRRLAYMQSKWLGSYKRTVNEIPSAESYKELKGEKLVGFSPANAAAISFNCREYFGAKHGVRVIGNLAAMLN
ncbi:hypothetical protein ACS0TY_032877 [Phlomoides rotata]